MNAETVARAQCSTFALFLTPTLRPLEETYVLEKRPFCCVTLAVCIRQTGSGAVARGAQCPVAELRRVWQCESHVERDTCWGSDAERRESPEVTRASSDNACAASINGVLFRSAWLSESRLALDGRLHMFSSVIAL